MIAACDEFSHYDALPGVTPVQTKSPAKKTAAKTAAKATQETAATKTPRKSTAKRSQKAPAKSPEDDPLLEAAELLVRAVRIAQDKADDDEWLNGGGVKSQMQRMDPSFKEKTLGFKNFSDFVESLNELVETRTDSGDGHLRLRLR